METVSIRNNRSHLLGIRRIDEIDLRDFPQGSEVKQEVAVLQGLDVLEVVVHVAVTVVLAKVI